MNHRTDGSKCPDGMPDVGPLSNEFYRLLLAADDAKQAIHRATIEGNRDKVLAAEVDRDERMGDLWKFKEKAAADLVLACRFLEEIHPGKLAELIDPVYRQSRIELDNTQDTAREAIGRVEQVEDAIVAILRKAVTGG